MPSSRPDLLPFALPKQIGLPYHGLCRNGKIGTFDYPQPTGGSTVYVQHPLHSAATADEDPQRKWQDYALLSGRDREIGGAMLTETQPDQAWIYCDERYSWVVRWGFVTSGVTQTLSIWLESPFGIFGNNLTMTPRMLASITYTPKSYAGVDQNLTVATYSRQFIASHSKTGAKSYINVGAYRATGNPWNKTTIPFSPTLRLLGINGPLGIHDSFRITLSGNGSIEPGAVGDGIGCTITHVAAAPDMIVAETVTVLDDGEVPDSGWASWEKTVDNPPAGGPCPGDPDGSVEGTVTQIGTATWLYWDTEEEVGSYEKIEGSSSLYTYKYLYMVDKNDADVYLQLTTLLDVSETHSGTASGEQTETTTYTWTSCYFGNKAYTETIETTGAWLWETERTYMRTITFTVEFGGSTTILSMTKEGVSTSNSVECTAPAFCDFGIFNATVDWYPPQITEYNCQINGSAVDCDANIIVSMITKNILQVYDSVGISAKLITPDGVTKDIAAFITADQATYDPGTGAITVSAADAICYV